MARKNGEWLPIRRDKMTLKQLGESYWFNALIFGLGMTMGVVVML